MSYPSPPAGPSRGGLTYLEGTLASRDGTELFVRSVRPPQPRGVLAIVHGYGDHSGCYTDALDRLAAAGFEAHAVDLRGHGRSSGRRGHILRWSDYLGDLSAFLARVRRSTGDAGGLGAETVPLYLLGQSHGALLLIHAALAGLPDVQGIILTGPFLRSRMAIPAWKLMVGRLADRLVPWLPIRTEIRAEMLTADPQIVASIRGDALRLQIATPRWFFSARAAQLQALARAGDLRLPVLIIQGESDPVSDPATTRLFYERLGSADKTYRPFPGTRHEPLCDVDRDAVWEAILSWLHDRPMG